MTYEDMLGKEVMDICSGQSGIIVGVMYRYGGHVELLCPESLKPTSQEYWLHIERALITEMIKGPK